MKTDLRKTKKAAMALGMALATASAQPTEDAREPVFVGVFQPAIERVTRDPLRCPDATHPLLFQLRGTAQTSLGAAALVQSHCEDEAHTSFRRGEQLLTLGTGPSISGVYEGRIRATPSTAADGVLILEGRYRHTGGSGLAERPNGSGITAGSVNTKTGAVLITISGTL
jgi:hypothetical protein